MTAASGRREIVGPATGGKPAWAEVWHLWRVILPRRSITGRILYGQVWRRHNGRQWIFKKFDEYDDADGNA
jgi:hypothetical protein